MILFYRFTIFILILTLPAAAQSIFPAGVSLTPFGLQGSRVNALAAESIENGLSSGALQIFAGTEKDGVFMADPFAAGAAWKSLDLQGRVVTALGVQHWGVGPRDGLTLFAALLPGISSRDTGMIYRREVGFLPDTAWTLADSGIDRSGLHRINALDAFYYTGHQPPERKIAGGERGLYSGGFNFWMEAKSGVEVKLNDIDCVLHWPALRNEVWGAGQIGVMPGVVRSTDRGITWGWKFLPAMIEGEAYGVAINPRSPDSVIVGGMNSLWVTGDSGKSWNTVSLSTSGVRLAAVAFDPVLAGNVYAGGADFQNGFWFFHSVDGGKSWRRILSPVNTPLDGVSAILPLNTGAPDHQARIFLATLGTGVWLYDPKAATGVWNEKSAAAIDPVAFPNPFGSNSPSAKRTLTIVYSASSSAPGEPVHLGIWDILGHPVAQGTERPSGRGANTLLWTPGELPSGLYIYCIQSGSARTYGRVLYMR